MSRRTCVKTLPAIVAAAVLCGGKAAHACSTCYGDPDSPMVKGALMGVYVMVGVVAFVLAGIAGTGIFWIHRSRQLARVTPPQEREGT